MALNTKKMFRKGAVVAVLVAGAGVFAYLSKDNSKSPATAPTVSTRPTVAAGNGVVSGVVHIDGDVPAPTVVMGECCPGTPPVVDETTVAGPTGGLANVVVFIKDGPNVASDAANSPAALDQKDCHFIPHVLAVHTGQNVVVTNRDPTVHNVDVQATNNPPENFSQASQGSSGTISFAHPEFVHVKCDVHPWMSATIAVFDHPFFAVTGKDGAFSIPHLPPGNYTLMAWHEEYGTMQQDITVSDQKPMKVDFHYKTE